MRKQELKELFTDRDIEDIAIAFHDAVEDGSFWSLKYDKQRRYLDAARDVLDLVLGMVEEFSAYQGNP